MTSQQKIFWETIKIFSESGVLPYIILIGSWVEYVYEMSYFKDFKSNLKTMDIDFLIKNIRMPRERINVREILEEQEYVASTDAFNGITKFFKNGEIEVEFIVKEMGKGQIEPYDVQSLGIKAEGLRNMDILSDNAEELYINGYYINVPIPQAYILHKMVISEKRGKKKDKDLQSVMAVLEEIQKSEPETDKFKLVYNKLSQKQRQKVDDFCKLNLIKLA